MVHLDSFKSIELMIWRCHDIWTHVFQHLDYIDLHQLKLVDKTVAELFQSPLLKSIEFNKCNIYKKRKKYLVIKYIVRSMETYQSYVYLNLNHVDFKLFKGCDIIENYSGNLHYTFKILHNTCGSTVEINLALQSDLDISNCGLYSNFDIEVNSKRYQLFPCDPKINCKFSPSGTCWPINYTTDKSYIYTKYKVNIENFISLLNDFYPKVDQCWIASNNQMEKLFGDRYLSPSIFANGPEKSPDNHQFTLIKVKCNRMKSE